ncbi:hypothetical protein GIB67_020656 [Kingdonia uniflora]|uniref:Retrotransposon Copia-like N-terminal domain-containing protein n=1 Tax=Kingdonia uniflora TaxID=39325 RepID=A0A7J7M9A7_9MAGN|nr:hypothetical protein GIB67_020656 [Kingdonia uniflora]
MAIGDESSSSSIISLIGMSEDVQSFNSVHDNRNLKIISQLLDSLNYVRWAQSMKLFVGGREKIGFLLASAPSEKVPIPLTAVKIYAKIMEKTRVFQFLAGINPNFEYARVYLLDMTPFLTLEEAHAYCLSDQSCRLPMPPISGIPSETSAMAIRYAYPAPPSVPSQTSHTSSPSLSQLPAASGNSRPSRKKCDYCGKWGHLKTTCHALHGRPAGYQPHPSKSSAHLSADSSVPDSSAFNALSLG